MKSHTQSIKLLTLVGCMLLVTSCKSGETDDIETGSSVVQTTKNWTSFTSNVIKDATTDAQKVEAIYNYICEHIAYDTSLSIYHADECIEQGRGVCQAYCEVFVLMAQSAGIEVNVINGQTINGAHGWIAAKYDGKWHLMDPCWGAGSVDLSGFSFRSNHYDWFDVDPYWMMLSHFPDDYSWAMIDRKVSLSEWQQMPKINKMAHLQMDGKNLLYGLLDHTITGLPEFYNVDYLNCAILDIPLVDVLNQGQQYSIHFTQLDKNDKYELRGAIWKQEPDTDGSTVIYFTPTPNNQVKFAVHFAGENILHTILSYDVK